MKNQNKTLATMLRKEERSARKGESSADLAKTLSFAQLSLP
ncbi:MAG TPA: hypothetical protein PLF38_10175 [Xylanibacter oryzae]|nr:hypothetical protein [Xylanibacter oryzae]